MCLEGISTNHVDSNGEKVTENFTYSWEKSFFSKKGGLEIFRAGHQNLSGKVEAQIATNSTRDLYVSPT